MKQKDIALLVIIVLVSGIISYFASNMLVRSPSQRSQKVEVVEPINDTFSTPSTKYFNSRARDFTQLIKIGGNSKSDPFKN